MAVKFTIASQRRMAMTKLCEGDCSRGFVVKDLSLLGNLECLHNALLHVALKSSIHAAIALATEGRRSIADKASYSHGRLASHRMVVSVALAP